MVLSSETLPDIDKLREHCLHHFEGECTKGCDNPSQFRKCEGQCNWIKRKLNKILNYGDIEKKFPLREEGPESGTERHQNQPGV